MLEKDNDKRFELMPNNLDPVRELSDRIREKGENEIDKLIKEQEFESYYLEFKIHSNKPDDNWNNFAKAISGFGNTAGGILVWGVDKSSNFEKKPFDEYIEFCEKLNEKISRLTEPPHSGVENFHISSSEKGKGYVVTIIPKSELPPHQVINKGIYYMRAGDSFLPIPHRFLESMFGRPPHGELDLNLSKLSIGFNSFKRNEESGIRMYIEISINLTNVGRSFINSHWVTVINNSLLSDRSETNLHGWDSIYYCFRKGESKTDRKLLMISKPDFKLAPTHSFEIIDIMNYLEPPLGEKIEFEIIAGVDNNLPKKIRISWGKELLQEIWDSQTLSREELKKKLMNGGQWENIYP